MSTKTVPGARARSKSPKKGILGTLKSAYTTVQQIIRNKKAHTYNEEQKKFQEKRLKEEGNELERKTGSRTFAWVGGKTRRRKRFSRRK